MTSRVSSRAALLRIGVLALFLIAAAVIGYKRGWFDPRHTLEHLARLHKSRNVVDFSLAFVVTVALATAVGAPGLPFIVAGGALFGTVLGAALGWVGAMGGAAVGYWLARTIGRGVVVNWLRRFKRANRAAAMAGDFRGMLRLRLIAFLPIGVVNFIGGLARMPFAPYMAATGLGIVPSILIYSYFADSLLERVGNGRSDALASLVVASVLLIGLSLTPRWLHRGND
jgi:uncharacterized membrane protein YdjX (TVP38/TMEM64 family)